MAYVRGSVDDLDHKLKHDHRDAFQDPGVLMLSQSFIPVRLSRSTHRDILPEFGMPERANMIMTFVAPDGQVLGEISAAGIAQIPSLRQKMRAVLEEYGKKLFADIVKPTFANANAGSQDLDNALQIVGRFRVKSADQAVIEFLGRQRLNASLRRTGYDVLAALSTKQSIDFLLKLAQEGDAQAGKSLERCTPVGAEMLLEELQADAEIFPYGIYEVVTKACNIRKTKPERWFERADLRLKEEEVKRVKELIEQAAEQWRRMNDERG
jgi:hypothetical protein